MLVVERICVEGFGSYKNPAMITLDGGGPIAIVGDNGSGKSTLVSKALAWGLFGKAAPERMGSSTSALKGKLILNENSDLATVRIILRQGVRQWEIIRMRGKKGGDAVTIDSQAATQGDIDAIVGVPYEVFVRTCLRGQGDPWNWLEATDGRKREILDVICGSRALEPRYEKARQMVNDYKAVLDRVRAQITSARRRVEDTDPAPLQAQAVAWDHEREVRHQAAQKEVASLSEALDVSIRADQAMVTMKEERPAEDPDLLIAHYRRHVEAENAGLVDAMADTSSKRAFMDALSGLESGSPCPTCGIQITEESSVLAERNLRRKAFEDAVREQGAKQASHQAAVAQLRGTEEWATKVRADQLSRARYRPQEPSARSALQAAVDRAKAITEAANPYQIAADEAERTHEAAARELTLLQELQVVTERDLGMAHAWSAVLSPKGVRARMADQAVGAIQDEANRWLDGLSNGTMKLILSSRSDGREMIRVTILIHGKERPLISLSGGEKRRVNLAVDMGIASVFSSSGGLTLSLLVLDEEVLSGLDQTGKHQVTKALHEAGIADVVVVDHDPALYGSLPRTVKVTKGSDGSRVEELDSG